MNKTGSGHRVSVVGHHKVPVSHLPVIGGGQPVTSLTGGVVQW